MILDWYVRSLADADTRHGPTPGDGTVLVRFGIRVTSRSAMRVSGQPPGELVVCPQRRGTAIRAIPEQVGLDCGRLKLRPCGSTE
jgi:hypothetical protein